eukprot:4301602-Pleurochrysis_carterae.AAC.1
MLDSLEQGVASLATVQHQPWSLITQARSGCKLQNLPAPSVPAVCQVMVVLGRRCSVSRVAVSSVVPC